MKIVGAKEIAAQLGISRQRVHELVQTHDDFPKPVGRLSGRIPVWDREQVVRWAERWERKPGRPSTREGA